MNIGEHTATAERTPFVQHRPQQIHGTLPAFPYKMDLLCRIKAVEARPSGRAETWVYRAQDPSNPQFCPEACFTCKAAVMKVPRAVVPRMLRAPVTLHHN